MIDDERLDAIADRGQWHHADIAELAAEVRQLRGDVERHESYGGELEGRVADQREHIAQLERELAAFEELDVRPFRGKWETTDGIRQVGVYKTRDEAVAARRKAAGLDAATGEEGGGGR